MVYLKNGTVKEDSFLINNKDLGFYLEICNDEKHEYSFYPNDEVYINLQNELVLLYDKIRDIYFPDIDSYYKDEKNIPIGIMSGGQETSVIIGKDEYLELKEKVEKYIPNLNAHIYVSDCQYLISTIQSLIEYMDFCFKEYFINISKISLISDRLVANPPIRIISYESRQLTFILETYFTKAYSILDLLCKIIYELENPVPKNELNRLKKLVSSEKLWGDRKKLKNIPVSGTIFEESEIIKLIESLRNEAVHNGAWELSASVYIQLDNREIIERYMLFPDYTQGRLDCVKNRKRFFSKEIKVNDVLPVIHLDYLRRLLNTVKYLNTIY